MGVARGRIAASVTPVAPRARLAESFLRHEARHVCVDVDPENARTRRFHARHGAASLSTHWLAWADVATALRDGHASEVRSPDDA